MNKTLNLDEIVETLSQLTVLDLSNLKKLLEEKWDVKAAAAAIAVAGPAAPAAGGDAGAAAEESTEFDVKLVAGDDSKKIAIIKAVREATGLGLKEAKELVESVPSDIKKSVNKAEAAEIKKKIEEAGGKVDVKGVN